MYFPDIIKIIADILKEFDDSKPIFRTYRPGIGPFGEPQIVGVIKNCYIKKGISAVTKRTPDLVIENDWGIEFKIVRPFGDNGNEAENWSVNMLHPYKGNVSLIGDAIKLSQLINFAGTATF